MNKIRFPYYPANVKITKPLGLISIEEFIRANKNPSEKIQKLFCEIQEASISGDLKLKAELKQKLFYFNPCVNTCLLYTSPSPRD